MEERRPLVTLAVATPLDPATGAPVTVRLSGGGERGHTYQGTTDWKVGLQPIAVRSGRLQYDDLGPKSGATPTALQLKWAGEASDLKTFANLYWPGAQLSLYEGEEGSEPALIQSSRVAEAFLDPGSEGRTWRISLVDAALDLGVPMLASSYAGTGGVEGGSAIAGRPRRRVWGHVANVELWPFDEANNLWTAADPARPIQAVHVIRDGGLAVAGVATVAWAGSVAATIAALAAVNLGDGTVNQAAVAPSIGGMVKWWRSDPLLLTVDLKGETDGGYVDAIGSIAAKVVAARTTIPLVAGTAEAANAARPGEAGIIVEEASETVAAVLDRLLVVGASLSWSLRADGQLEILPWEWGASTQTLAGFEVTRGRTFKPHHTRRVGYARNHKRMTKGEIASALLAGDVEGLGDLATRDVVDLATGDVVNKTASNISYSGGVPVEALKPAEAGADVTSDNTAAAIEGQGALATQNAADFGTQVTGAAKAALLADAAQAKADATAAQADLANIALDGKIHKSEKPTMRVLWQNTVLAYVKALDRAATVSVSTSALVSAYNTLATYIAGLDLNSNSTTNFNRAVWESYWSAYSTAFENVWNAISAADNGATIGTNLVMPGVGVVPVQRLDNAENSATNLIAAQSGGSDIMTIPAGQYGTVVDYLRQDGVDKLGGFTPGEWLTVSCELWHDATSRAAGQSITCFLHCFRADGTWMAVAAATVDATAASPTYATATVQIPPDPANFVGIGVSFYKQGGSAGQVGGVGFGRRFKAERGRQATAFAPGKQPGATDGAHAGINLRRSDGLLLPDVRVDNDYMNLTRSGDGTLQLARPGSLLATASFLGDPRMDNDQSDIAVSGVDVTYTRRPGNTKTVRPVARAGTNLQSSGGQVLTDPSILNDRVVGGLNIFVDSAFQSLLADDPASWGFKANVAGRVLQQDAGDGRRARVDGGAGEVTFGVWRRVSKGDKIDCEAEFFPVHAGTLSYAGIYVSFYEDDGTGAPGTYVTAGWLLEATSITPYGQWSRQTGFAVVPSTGAICWALVRFVFAFDGDHWFVRNPRGYISPRSAFFLDPNGRQRDSRLNRAFVQGGVGYTRYLSITPGINDVSLTNFEVDLGDGYISMPLGGTIGGLSPSTTYYAFLLTPNNDASSASISISAAFDGNTNLNRVFLGMFTTQAAGGGGGGVGGGGWNGPPGTNIP